MSTTLLAAEVATLHWDVRVGVARTTRVTVPPWIGVSPTKTVTTPLDETAK
jgi:hypothetical protein